MMKDYKYFTSIQYLPKASFDFSCSIQKIKFKTNIDIINYIIYLADITNKDNIIY